MKYDEYINKVSSIQNQDNKIFKKDSTKDQIRFYLIDELVPETLKKDIAEPNVTKQILDV